MFQSKFVSDDESDASLQDDPSDDEEECANDEEVHYEVEEPEECEAEDEPEAEAEEEPEVEEPEEPVPKPKVKAKKMDKKIKTMDIEKIADMIVTPSLIAMCGATGSGKTVLVKALIEALHKSGRFSWVAVMSGSASYNEDYAWLPPERVKGIDMDRLKAINKAQKRAWKSGVRAQTCLILDDWIGKLKTHQNETFDQIAGNSRQYGLTIILLTQYVNKLSPTLKENIRFFFLTRLARPSVAIMSDYQTMFNSKAEFIEAYEKGTSKRYSSLFLQTVNPYKDNVVYCKPVKYGQ